MNTTIEGVGEDAPVTANEYGVEQSRLEWCPVFLPDIINHKPSYPLGYVGHGNLNEYRIINFHDHVVLYKNWERVMQFPTFEDAKLKAEQLETDGTEL